MKILGEPYKDDYLYHLDEIIEFPDPIHKRVIKLKTSKELLPGLCLGCYFHNIAINNCMRPHARCCTPDGKYKYIFVDIEHPMQIKAFKKVAEANKNKRKGTINVPTGLGLIK